MYSTFRSMWFYLDWFTEGLTMTRDCGFLDVSHTSVLLLLPFDFLPLLLFPSHPLASRKCASDAAAVVRTVIDGSAINAFRSNGTTLPSSFSAPSNPTTESRTCSCWSAASLALR